MKKTFNIVFASALLCVCSARGQNGIGPEALWGQQFKTNLTAASALQYLGTLSASTISNLALNGANGGTNFAMTLSINGTNFTLQVGLALTNLVTASTNGFVGPNVTNGLATIPYAQSLTNGFVGPGVTNGLATTTYAQGLTNGFVPKSVTNGLATISYAQNATNTLAGVENTLLAAASNAVVGLFPGAAAGANVTITTNTSGGITTYTIASAGGGGGGVTTNIVPSMPYLFGDASGVQRGRAVIDGATGLPVTTLTNPASAGGDIGLNNMTNSTADEYQHVFGVEYMEHIRELILSNAPAVIVFDGHSDWDNGNLSAAQKISAQVQRILADRGATNVTCQITAVGGTATRDRVGMSGNFLTVYPTNFFSGLITNSLNASPDCWVYIDGGNDNGDYGDSVETSEFFIDSLLNFLDTNVVARARGYGPKEMSRLLCSQFSLSWANNGAGEDYAAQFPAIMARQARKHQCAFLDVDSLLNDNRGTNAFWAFTAAATATMHSWAGGGTDPDPAHRGHPGAIETEQMALWIADMICPVNFLGRQAVWPVTYDGTPTGSASFTNNSSSHPGPVEYLNNLTSSDAVAAYETQWNGTNEWFLGMDANGNGTTDFGLFNWPDTVWVWYVSSTNGHHYISLGSAGFAPVVPIHQLHVGGEGTVDALVVDANTMNANNVTISNTLNVGFVVNGNGSGLTNLNGSGLVLTASQGSAQLTNNSGGIEWLLNSSGGNHRVAVNWSSGGIGYWIAGTDSGQSGISDWFLYDLQDSLFAWSVSTNNAWTTFGGSSVIRATHQVDIRGEGGLRGFQSYFSTNWSGVFMLTNSGSGNLRATLSWQNGNTQLFDFGMDTAKNGTGDLYLFDNVTGLYAWYVSTNNDWTTFGAGGTANNAKHQLDVEGEGVVYANSGFSAGVAGTMTLSKSANSTRGSATLSGGTVTVSTTAVKTGDLIWFGVTISTSPGFLSYSIVNNTSFTITSSSGSDASVVQWAIIH